MTASELPNGGLFVGRQRFWPAIAVETRGTSEQMERMFQRIGVEWSAMGAAEPHWSVFTIPAFRQDVMEEVAFYNTGAFEMGEITAFFDRVGEDIGGVRRCVELGCGVARFTAALAKVIPDVVGVDISAPHLRVAEDYARRAGLTNTRFLQLHAIQDIARLPRCELLLSFIVLQHNPPPIIREMLRLALRRVRPGGFALFQVPTYGERYSFEIETYLATRPDGLEMHVLPQDEVFALLADTGFDVLEVQEDTRTASPHTISQTFFARRKGGRRRRLSPRAPRRR